MKEKLTTDSPLHWLSCDSI